MNILYLSCHAILEYDELKLLASLGDHIIHSIGSYTNPQSPGDPKRPPIHDDIHLPVDLQHIDISNRFHQDNLHNEHLEWADIIIFMHDPDYWIGKQIYRFLEFKKPVVFRSIGQSSPTIESYLNQLKHNLGDLFKVIRYSVNEAFIASINPIRPEMYVPYLCDAVIPFCKDSTELRYTWPNTEHDNNILFVTQSASQRGSHCHFDEVNLATKDIPDRVLIGPNNEEWRSENLIVDCPPYHRLLDYYATSRLFVYTGTVPASYTLAPIEAMAVGTPLITISRQWWARTHESWISPNVFEMPNLFPFVIANDEISLNKMCKELLSSDSLLFELSHRGRELYESTFSETVVRPLWKEFLDKCVA